MPWVPISRSREPWRKLPGHLQRKGLIIKKHYYPEDVAFIIKDFKQSLVNHNALDTNKFGEEELNYFLISRNLKIPEPEPIDSKPEIEGDDKEILNKEDTEVLPEPEIESEPEPETKNNHDTES